MPDHATPKSQISVSYDHFEDRLLLQVASDGRCGQIWLTRRIISNVSGSIDQLGDMLNEDQSQMAPKEKAISQFLQENEVENTDFSEPFENAGLEIYPAGGPLLATKISFTPMKSGRIRITFENREEEELPFSLQKTDFRMLVHMISEAASKGDWQLSFTPHKQEQSESLVLH